ncbi:hypothetical protein L7F22_024823 [Adiantum nelumboides]|nr:hypothetical protein [Adiantum nelumboides]
MVAARINFQQGAKRNLKPMETKEKHEPKGKNHPQNSFKGNSSNSKAKEKGVYKGKNRLILEELERYRKDNGCFKCGEQGHSYRTCPQRNARDEQPRASIIEAPKVDVHCKGSPLSYAWGKVREHDAFILFDPGSTHNFISHELAAKLGIQEFEMGDPMKVDEAFIGQDASVTPLIGKLRLHIQGYVDKEDFFISPLKHEDVILGAPWFDRLAASIKFLERKISFKFRKKDMYTIAQESDDIPGELPPKRGDDDHMIELIPGSSPPNKPPYRVSQAQQEEIMRQVNELAEKGMVRPSSSPFCSPVLLVQKKDGTYHKVLAFIEQFDAAFGDEGFTESSKLRHVAMHFQKSARQWWASLRANGEAPRTWKNLRVSIMKQFLSSDAKDKVLTEWRSLKLTPYESIQKYVDKFWDLHLKATVYRKIDFEEQKQQFCAGLTEDIE